MENDIKPIDVAKAALKTTWANKALWVFGFFVAAAGATTEDAQLRKQALLKALAELPERDRKIVCLRYGAELSAEEVEEVTHVSAANVRKICERQRKALLERLESR